MAIEIFEKVCAKNDWAQQGDKAEIFLPDGRRQLVYFEEFESEGEAMVRLWSAIGGAEIITEARLRAALGLNFSSPFGALAVREDELVMVDTFLARDVSEDEMAGSIQHLAATADRFEKLIYQRDEK